MQRRVALSVILVLTVVSCGGGTESTATTLAGEVSTSAGQGETTGPTVEATTTSASGETATGLECALVPAGTVAAAFDATSASGEPGVARNCTFTLVDGLVPTVEVFHYGSSTDWDGVKAGFEENRGGVTEVPGVGDEAFQPNDVGPYEIVVRYLDIIYSVAVQTGTGGPEVEGAILELATAIAGG